MIKVPGRRLVRGDALSRDADRQEVRARSTGTNFYGVLQLAHEMVRQDKQGSIVTLICDPGDALPAYRR